jgi:hypothetical protein
MSQDIKREDFLQFIGSGIDSDAIFRQDSEEETKLCDLDDFVDEVSKLADEELCQLLASFDELKATSITNSLQSFLTVLDSSTIEQTVIIDDTRTSTSGQVLFLPWWHTPADFTLPGGRELMMPQPTLNRFKADFLEVQGAFSTHTRTWRLRPNLKGQIQTSHPTSLMTQTSLVSTSQKKLSATTTSRT